MFNSSSFSEYKKSLEDILQNISFLYSGDVISSEERTITMKLKHSSLSPSIIRAVLLDIYVDSMKEMYKKSSEVSLDFNEFKDVYQLFDVFNSPRFLFYSNNSKLNIDFAYKNLESDDFQFLPTYFTQTHRLMSYGKDVLTYFSPEIEDTVNCYKIYISDSPIQSLVWSLQNMSYDIEDCKNYYKHTLRYNFYNCDFKSTNFMIKNICKLRDEKIDTLLDDY